MCIFSQHNVIKRRAVLAARPRLLPQPADLPERRAAGPGHPAVPLRAAPGRLPVPRQFRERDAAPEAVRAGRPPHRIFRRRETGTRVLPDFPLTAARGRAAGRPSRAPARSGRRSRPGPPAPSGSPSAMRRPMSSPTRTSRSCTSPAAPAATSSRRAGAASLDLLQPRPPRSAPRPARRAQQAAETDERRAGRQVAASATNGDQHCRRHHRRAAPGRQAAAPRISSCSSRTAPVRATRAERGHRHIAAAATSMSQRLEGELRAHPRAPAGDHRGAGEHQRGAEILERGIPVAQRGAAVGQRGAGDLEGGAAVGQRGADAPSTASWLTASRNLTRANSDLKNLLESTQIATVFLDNDLRVMNFTPAIDGDLPPGRDRHRPADRPYQAAHRLSRNCRTTFAACCARLASVERELDGSEPAARYIVRVLPYRSIDNFIAGVVMTFVDVTAHYPRRGAAALLLAEFQHRVRNTLAVVRAIARRTADSSSTVDEFASHLDGRLNAFARTQALVTRDPEGGVRPRIPRRRGAAGL